MDAKEHYKNHLGNFYSWMIGDWVSKKDDFLSFLKEHSIQSKDGEIAVDLGAGNGIQTIALEELGFHVIAIDFNPQLLRELRENITNQQTEIIEGDIREFGKHLRKKASLILCCGDTITHLASFAEISKLIKDIYEQTETGGHIILSFRDYAVALEGDARFIPVKADENQIHTCILEYEEERIKVTDLLYQKIDSDWKMKIGSYFKVRVTEKMMISLLEAVGFELVANQNRQRMITIIGKRK